MSGITKILTILLILSALGGGVYYFFLRPKPTPPTNGDGNGTTPSTTEPSSQSETTGTEETGSINISWTRDEGKRIDDGGAPSIQKSCEKACELHYCGTGGILSAGSNEGYVFHKRAQVLIAPASGQETVVCDPTAVQTPDNLTRMYYGGADKVGGGTKRRIFSAITADGITFLREGVRIDSDKTGDGGWASAPEAIVLPDERVRIYYVTATNHIVSAISKDGIIFKKEDGYRIDVANFVDPAILALEDGRYLLIVAVPDIPSGSEGTLPAPGLYSFISNDGLTFSSRQTVLVENDVSDPTVTYLGDQTLRVYFGKQSSTGGMSIESVTGTIE